MQSRKIAKIGIFLLNIFIAISPLDYISTFEFHCNFLQKLNDCVNNPI